MCGLNHADPEDIVAVKRLKRSLQMEMLRFCHPCYGDTLLLH